jgi:hypothetical protein
MFDFFAMDIPYMYRHTHSLYTLEFCRGPDRHASELYKKGKEDWEVISRIRERQTKSSKKE